MQYMTQLNAILSPEQRQTIQRSRAFSQPQVPRREPRPRRGRARRHLARRQHRRAPRPRGEPCGNPWGSSICLAEVSMRTAFRG
jgi:hypothetical protein